MNIKSALLVTGITIIFGTTLLVAEQSQENRDAQEQGINQENLTQRQVGERAYAELLRRRALGLPSNPDETPSSPKTIYHDKEGDPRTDFKRPPYNIEEARIWFGKDEAGNPCYQSIGEHLEKNPQFQEVGLVIYHKPGWFSAEKFEGLGTIAHEDARERLKDIISEMDGYLLWKHKKRGVWCPLQNVFIGGTGDIGTTHSNGTTTRNMCEVYASFLQARDQASKLKR